MQLLRYKNDYWRKCYTATWVKFGDEDTKFFHAAATERYRRNNITHLEAQDGRIATEHNEKAAILLETYKTRMGHTENPIMHFDLSNLVQMHEHLDILSEPFTKEKIDAVVKKMPTYKSLGPDGF